MSPTTTTNEYTDREIAAALNPAPAGRKPRTRKPKPSPLTATVTTHVPAPGSNPPADALLTWARAGVGLTMALSAGLNGYANAEHCAAGMAWAGWTLGVCVPALVLILSRVAGGAYLRGRRGVGLVGAAVVLLLLALSVRHCAHTFAALTGSDTASAVLWAIGVDVGLVVCELVTLNKRGR